MRAVVHNRYGGPEVLRLEEVDRPVPGDDEVLVRIHATTVNRTDCGFRLGQPFFIRAFSGVRRPKFRILGNELAGEVEAVGSAVTEFAPGDRVFGVDQSRFAAHAEFACLRERAPLATVPDGMPFEEAAAVSDGFVLARTCLRPARLGPGRRILIYGASGSIGTAGVQLARHFGAHVTAVCNTPNVDIVGSLGPDEVIDYTQDDFTRNGESYDVIFDAVGKHAFGRCRGSLARGGLFIVTDFGPRGQNPFLALGTAVTSRFGARRVRMPIPRYSKEHVLFLKGLIEAGEYRAVVDRCYPLDEVVEATRYVETGQKTGNVVLTVT
jgi:NADPH:quinone reductase-like Zn-dependent oxidoreductase